MDNVLDNVFIDIAIAFALTYALLSLLVMRVQETVHGNWMSGRVQNLHRLLQEALMDDKTLVQQLLMNPLLYSLYEAKAPREGQFLVIRPQGPSEIPPDLFARALLMELNPEGTPPSDKQTPAEFIDFLDKCAKPDSARGQLVRALRGLLPGHEGNWPGFEAAIAAWFEAIGERSKGWWKRRSSMAGFWIALTVCALLNVDAGRIAGSFGEDDELRRSFVRIAQGVQDVRDHDSKAAAPAASAAAGPGTVAAIIDPVTRTVSRMNDAIALLRVAFKRDLEIRKYGFYVGNLKVCGTEVKDLLNERKTSDKDLVQDKEGIFLSNSDTWQRVLPLMLARIENAVVGDTTEQSLPVESSKQLREARRCVTEISAWVRAARGVSAQTETQRVMNEAAIALEDTKVGLSLLIRTAEAGLNAKRLFSSDPAVYDACARATPTTLTGLAQCVRSQQNPVNRLPIGMTTANRNAQFCVACDPDGKSAEACGSPQTGFEESMGKLLCQGSAAAIPQLKLPAYQMQFSGLWGLVVWVMGVLVSAFFVSLGAPFWFDVLSKFMRVRASVSAQESAATRQRAEGTRALPAASPAPRPSDTGGTGGQRGTLPLVIGAGNEYEDGLTIREVQALQQRLGVKATGELDEPTRLAIANATREQGLGETQCLTANTYSVLVGRPSSKSRQPIAGLPSGRLVNGEANPQVALLAKHLAAKMSNFKHPISSNPTNFDDDLRALCVLWRYKTEQVTPLRNRQVFKMATANPAQFDEVDQTLLQAIADPLATGQLLRHPKAWMDWAIGELGQVEAGGSSRATSNPRVCAYLDTLALGDTGDKTAWCAAFVAWVLTQFRSLDLPAGSQFSAFPATPARAQSWINWPPRGLSTAGAPNPGDIVVVTVGTGHHVGFALESDTSTGQVWILGGNQHGGTCVCLSRFPLTSVAWAAAPM